MYKEPIDKPKGGRTKSGRWGDDVIEENMGGIQMTFLNNNKERIK